MMTSDWKLVKLLDEIEDVHIKIIRTKRSLYWFWLATVAMWSTVVATAIAGALVNGEWFVGTVVLGALFGIITAITGSCAYENLHKAQDQLRTAQRAHRDYIDRAARG